MRCVAALALIAPLVAGCTPYLPAKGDFGTSALVPAGDISAEYAGFNAYDPGINPLLARQICATAYQPLEEDQIKASPGKLIEARGTCATHQPIFGP